MDGINDAQNDEAIIPGDNQISADVVGRQVKRMKKAVALNQLGVQPQNGT